MGISDRNRDEFTVRLQNAGALDGLDRDDPGNCRGDRSAENFFDRRVLNDPALIHDGNLVAERESFHAIVSDEQDGYIERAKEAPELTAQRLSSRPIYGREWFVQQKQPRLGCECAG